MYTAIFFRHLPNLVSAWSTGRTLCSEEGCMHLEIQIHLVHSEKHHKCRPCCIILYSDRELLGGDLEFYIIYILHHLAHHVDCAE